jgi:lipopolysaccharide transport system permease protein
MIAGSRTETVIEPRGGWQPLNLREMWEFRELLYFLAWRDIKVRYKQTALGVLWAVLQPVLAMVVFSVLFGRLARLPSDGVPYAVFVLIGLLPWNYFVGVLAQSTTSLVTGANLVSKLYFPRLLIPASSAVSVLVDLAIASAVLGVVMFYQGTGISVGIALVPLLLLLTLVNALAFGLWLSALNVRYRDVQYAVPFLIQLWFFLTPVVYPTSFVGTRYGWLLALNPMAGVIEGFRAAILGHLPIPWLAVSQSAAVGLMTLVSGLFFFRRVERHFADVI